MLNTYSHTSIACFSHSFQGSDADVEVVLALELNLNFSTCDYS